MSSIEEKNSLTMEKMWKAKAIEKQMEYFDSLGTRPYDKIDKTDLFQLKKKVGFATCGAPADFPGVKNQYTGYDTEQLGLIKHICKCIVSKSDFPDIIHFSCIFLTLPFKDGTCNTPVFRIRTECGYVFIDIQARVYLDWTSFMKENKLPDCEYCYPVNGEYNPDNREVEFAFSPASKLFRKTLDRLDTVGSIAAVGAAGVCAVGAVVAVAPAAMAAAGVTAVCTGVYSLARSVDSLIDRKNHDQSIKLTDREARAAWLNIGASVACASAVKAVSSAKKIVDSGKTLSKLSIFGLRALNVTSLMFSGFGFVESLVICVVEYKKGTLTKKQVFDLSCEVLFLFNAIASAKATNDLVKKMNVTFIENPSIQKTLTKTQKRNLRRRNAKRRAKGLAPNTSSATSNQSEKNSKYAKVPETGECPGRARTVARVILAAMKAINPRIEKIHYSCQSIAHDFESWKSKDLTGPEFLINISKTTTNLFKSVWPEIKEDLEEIVSYFEKLLAHFSSMFENATTEKKMIFGTKVTNAEVEIDVVVTEAENEVAACYDRMGISSSDPSNMDESDDSDFSREVDMVLTKSSTITLISSLPCKELIEFGAIIEEVKNEVVTKFKEKIANYTKFVEAAVKSDPRKPFDIEKYHTLLGIKGDVTQFMFESTVEELAHTSSIYKIKTKLMQNKHNQDETTLFTVVWEEENEKVFVGFGPSKGGKLTDTQLRSLGKRVLKRPFSHAVVLLKNDNVHVIKLSGDYKSCETIVVIHQSITTENTAEVWIFVVHS